MNYKINYYKSKGLDKCDVLFCLNCGKIATNLHHIVYKSHCGTDKPDNLAPLCYNCHSGHHNNNNPTTEQLIKLKKNECTIII